MRKPRPPALPALQPTPERESISHTHTHIHVARIAGITKEERNGSGTAVEKTRTPGHAHR